MNKDLFGEVSALPKAKFDRTIYDKIYRQNNKEKQKEYRKENRKKILMGKKLYRENNKEKISSGRKLHYENNKVEIWVKAKNYHKRNRKKISAQQKIYYKKNKSKFSAISRKNLYGVTDETFNQMLEKQNNVCAICGKPEITKNKSGDIRNLSIDHCHKTNKIRGLLCQKCNHAIGLFQENSNYLFNAIKYLQ